MYLAFYGLREKPFSLLPDPEYLYLGRKHRAALTLLEYGLISQSGFVVISGGIGTGKTTLICRQLADISRNRLTVGLIANTHPSFGELLEWVLMAFGLEYSGKGKTALFQTFRDFVLAEYAQRRRTVLIIDEAQNLSVDTLEEIRMLSNVNANKDHILQIILVGQEQLLEKLARPELEQFVQRIAVSYRLGPLEPEETNAYIRHRLRIAGCKNPKLFTDAACASVHGYTKGIPRLINLACDNALVYGFAEDRRLIDADLIRDVVKDREASGLPLASTEREESPQVPKKAGY